ncbi:MAG: hypothetical protein HGA47_01415 [Zoogloea sp.]|nr:hypothetical protein [Zoogloea sp.]
MKLVVDSRLTFADHIRMSDIERNYFKSKYWTPPYISWEYYLKNNETYLGVRDMDSGKMAGHICILPIADELFQKIIAGDHIDSDIDIDHILKYDAPGRYKLHFFSIAIENRYKLSNIHAILFKALKAKVGDLAERGIVFTDVTAECVTKAGAVICESILNMKCVTQTAHDSRIYWANGLFGTASAAAC